MANPPEENPYASPMHDDQGEPADDNGVRPATLIRLVPITIGPIAGLFLANFLWNICFGRLDSYEHLRAYLATIVFGGILGTIAALRLWSLLTESFSPRSSQRGEP